MREEESLVAVFFRTIAIFLSIVIIIVALLYGGWLYLTKDLTLKEYNPNVSVDIDENSIYESDIKNVKEKIIDWQKNGQPAKDDNVLNILLMGIDVESSDMNKNSRADAMMLVSINHNTKTITLASILRDQYCYIEKRDSFEKLHHGNGYGGPEMQIELIEKYYKISIDNYALVNFYSLPKIIDEMGGIKVNITKTEADYMNTYWGTKVKTGENVVDGATALIYMRIRHYTGGDTARVSRQQQVIKTVFNEMKKQSKTELIALMTELVKYVRTGYTSNEVLSLSADALTKGWFDYKIQQISLPDESCSTGTTIDNVWYWQVDYPLAAQKMQWAFYGKTNIELYQDRESWIK